MKYIGAFLIITAFLFLILYYIKGEHFHFKQLRTYISYFFVVALFVLNYEVSNLGLRFLFNIIIYILAVRILFKTNIKESIVLGIFSSVIVMISEFIYTLCASGLVGKDLFPENTPLYVFINNFFIGLGMVILCLLLPVKKVYSWLIKSVDKIEDSKVLIFALAILLIINLTCVVTYLSYIRALDFIVLPIFSTVLNFIIMATFFVYLKVKNNYIRVYEKYSVSLQNIRNFETLLEENRIKNHENQNQLRIVRGMSKNKKVISYIDNLLGEKSDSDEQLMAMVGKIPDGGLRGLIYEKIMIMKKENIPMEVIVDKKINHSRVAKIDDSVLVDICKILGVFLDNAIEAVLNLEERYILIELYEEDSLLTITITNNYEGYIDMDEIFSPGVTTKGKNHGYGLSLVKEILKGNNKIIHECELIENNFVQKIKIKV